VTPGQDTVLTIRNVLLGGRAAGTFTAIGVSLGQATWTLVASAGVTALLLASEPAFAAVRFAGAAFLAYLGLQALVAAIRGGSAHAVAAEHAKRLRPAAALRQGLVSNLGNPKMAVFFTSLLPQFVPSGVGRAGDLLGRPRIRRVLDGVVGTVLVAFGVRLATQQR